MKAAVVRQFGRPLVIEGRPVPETRVIYETRPLSGVNEAIDEVLNGKAKARLVLPP